MPEPQVPAFVRVVSDLRVEMQRDRGGALLHLHGDTDGFGDAGGLVLDVDQPVAVARVLGWGRRVRLPPQARELVGATPVAVRSRGRDLGTATLTSSGAVRLRPTTAGVFTVARDVVAGSSGRSIAVVVGGPALAVLLTVSYLQRRRRRGVST